MANSQRNQQLDDTEHHLLRSSLEQRRALPRVRLRIPIQVGLAGGQIACARICNLSPDGIQIHCDSLTARRIHPSGEAINDRSGPRVLIALRLKHGADMRTHVLRCKVFYLLPQSEQEVLIGLEFEDLNPAQRDVIDAVLGASLER